MNNHKINIYDILEGGSFTENNYDLNPIYKTYDDFQVADPELFQKLYDLDFYSSNMEMVPEKKWSQQNFVPTQNETTRNVMYENGFDTYLKFRIIYSEHINDFFIPKEEDQSSDSFPNIYSNSNELSLIEFRKNTGQAYIYNINYFNSFQLKKISSILSPNDIQKLQKKEKYSDYKSIEIYLVYTELPSKTMIRLLYVNIEQSIKLNIMQSKYYGSFYNLVFNNIKLQIAAVDSRSSYNTYNNYITINNNILKNYIYLYINENDKVVKLNEYLKSITLLNLSEDVNEQQSNQLKLYKQALIQEIPSLDVITHFSFKITKEQALYEAGIANQKPIVAKDAALASAKLQAEQPQAKAARLAEQKLLQAVRLAESAEIPKLTTYAKAVLKELQLEQALAPELQEAQATRLKDVKLQLEQALAAELQEAQAARLKDAKLKLEQALAVELQEAQAAREKAKEAAKLQKEQTDVAKITSPSEYKIYVFKAKIPIDPSSIEETIINKNPISVGNKPVIINKLRDLKSYCQDYNKLKICDKFTNNSISNLFNNYITNILINDKEDTNLDPIQIEEGKSIAVKINRTKKKFFLIYVDEKKKTLKRFCSKFIENYLSNNIMPEGFLKQFMIQVYNMFYQRIINYIFDTYKDEEKTTILKKNNFNITLSYSLESFDNVYIKYNVIDNFITDISDNDIDDISDTDIDKYDKLLNYLFIFSINLYNFLESL